MPRFNTRRALPLLLLAGSVAVPAVVRPQGRPDPVPTEDGDVPRLLARLREKGLDFRAVPKQKDGSLSSGMFLTLTDRDWDYFNHLSRCPEAIERWRGTMSCEPAGAAHRREDLDNLWGDCYLLTGPFLFFGDRQLLEQVRAALAPL